VLSASDPHSLHAATASRRSAAPTGSPLRLRSTTRPRAYRRGGPDTGVLRPTARPQLGGPGRPAQGAVSLVSADGHEPVPGQRMGQGPHAQTRRPDPAGAAPLDTAETRYTREPADTSTPEQAFEKQWALTLLEEVLRRLRRTTSRTARSACSTRSSRVWWAAARLSLR